MIANHAEVSKRKGKKRHISRVAQKKKRVTSKKRADLDIGEELNPLNYYMHDREEMVNQAFAAIGKKDLKALLFPAIEYLSLDELKKLCLGQLQEMSNKDVALVLEGRKLNSFCISPCDVANKRKDTKRLCFKEQNENLVRDDFSPKKLQTENLATITRELLQCASSEVELSNINTNTEKNESCSEGKKDKLLLEILELEMRARAIRALLQYHKDTHVSNDFEQNITP